MSEPTALPLKVEAKVDATARGSDTGTLLACATGALFFLAGCALAATPAGKEFPALVYGSCIGGFLLAGGGVLGWLLARSSRNQAELAPTEIIVGTLETTVRSPAIENHDQIAALLRAIQGRRQLPAPHGQAGTVPRAYTPEEKRRFLENQSKREAEFDRARLEALSRQRLPAPGSGEQSQALPEDMPEGGIIGVSKKPGP